MDFLLRGNHPVLATLRDQFAVAIVKEPDFTGVGFFIHFVVPTTAVRLERDRPELWRQIRNYVDCGLRILKSADDPEQHKN